MMSEIAKTIIQEKLPGLIQKTISHLQWKQLFIDTGGVLSSHSNADPAFCEDLKSAFSADNMSDLADEMEKCPGTELIPQLRRALTKLMMQYEMPAVEAETYTQRFIQHILQAVCEADPDKAQAAQMMEAVRSLEDNMQKLLKAAADTQKLLAALGKKDDSLCTLYTIEKRILRESQNGKLDLDFFEIDDSEFQEQFAEAIDGETIHIVGPSREETFYRILQLLKNQYASRHVLIAENPEDWQKLAELKISGYVLVPAFYNAAVTPIAGNHNIFIYHSKETCYERDHLELRRRTRSNLVNALERYDYPHREAFQMVESTNGIYSAMKKRLFKTILRGQEQPWESSHSKTVIAALLCGSWTDDPGDRQFFEEMTGREYDECMAELQEYGQQENPFILMNTRHSEQYRCLASPEDAWAELEKYVSAEAWQKLISFFKEAMAEKDPTHNEILRFQVQSIKGEKPEPVFRWSKRIKNGMIQTLIMRPLFTADKGMQRWIDSIVKDVLAPIDSVDQWNYISDYLPDLCEASPEAVLSKLEQEMKNPAMMKDFFASHEGGFLGNNNYVPVMWTMEQLIQQKQYAPRAIQWLWEADGFNIEYKISNNPKETLLLVFCPWLNISAIQGKEKIEAAKAAVRVYPNAWNIIAEELPGNTKSMMVTLSTPRYRETMGREEVLQDEVFECYHEYLIICADMAGDRPERWSMILNHLTSFEKDVVEENLNRLVAASRQMNDRGRTDIREKIRDIIFQHRHFVTAPWSVGEETIGLFEKAMANIQVENPVYDYLYLFISEHDLNILHPVPYEKDHYRENKSINDEKAETEIREKMREFKERRLSVETLIDLALEDGKYEGLGNRLAQYYCDGQYDEAVLSLLMKKDENGFQTYRYVHALNYYGTVDLRAVILRVRTEKSDLVLLSKIISLQVVKNAEEAIIFQEEEAVKRTFWTSGYRVNFARDAEAEAFLTALEECARYGDMQVYAEVLYESLNHILPEQVYEAFLKIDSISNTKEWQTMSNYYLQKVLEYLQKQYMDDDDKCLALAQKEWFMGSILEWKEMKCTQRIVKRSPDLYAYLISVIYKRNPDDEPDPKKQEFANRIYSRFEKMHFCPGEEDGTVSYEFLKAWADGFRELLKGQGQEWLWASSMGELLAYSPDGVDGQPPCEGVRQWVEEHYSEEFARTYITAERNKRGVFTASAGKGERRLAEKYKGIADKLRMQYPHTAGIYDDISELYLRDSERERKYAEDDQ